MYNFRRYAYFGSHTVKEEKIREIFFRHLKVRKPNRAIAETYREVSEYVLAQAYEGQIVEKTAWELLLKIIKGLSTANLYRPYFEVTDIGLVSFGPSNFEEVIFISQTSRDALAYVIDHFDELTSEEDKKHISVPVMRMFLDKLDREIADSVQSVAQNQMLSMRKEEFVSITSHLAAAMRFIMGQERYSEFANEFDKHIPTLKMYYYQIVSPPDRTH